MTDKMQRFNKGKPKMHYLGYLYPALVELMRVFEFGEKKYEKNNWMKPGATKSEMLDSAIRHTLKCVVVEDDEESGQKHAAHAVWNLLAYMLKCKMGQLDDDITKNVPDELKELID